MKKFILIYFISLFTSLNAMGQQWYFIHSDLDPQGNDPSKRDAYVLIRDNGGTFWMARHAEGIDGWGSGLGKIQKHLLKSESWYTNEFNNSKYDFEGADYLRSPSNVSFHKLPLIQKTEKCYVFKFSNWSLAVSLDFRTLVEPVESPDPSYYTSYPASDFIVRKSVDDLF